MAQLVEHHLAKVRVAGSNPVVRSIVIRRPVKMCIRDSPHRVNVVLSPRANRAFGVAASLSFSSELVV